MIGVTMFTLGAISVPVTGIGGTSVLTMTLTIFGCYLLAITMFLLLAKNRRLSEIAAPEPAQAQTGLSFCRMRVSFNRICIRNEPTGY